LSFLSPLYLLGALAVAAPIVLHLIRRAPKGEVSFSSLLFLAPAPPRLPRWSRPEHLFLLFLRAAALGLLAFAFMRPFLRQPARLDIGSSHPRRVALVLDASASMRRGDAWERALTSADDVIRRCGPDDQLSILAFDDVTRPVLGFAEWRALDPARRTALAQARIHQLQPSWGATQLGQALIDAMTAVRELADAPRPSRGIERRVVVISDLQQGSRLDPLGQVEWPSDIELELRAIAVGGNNAGAHLLGSPAQPLKADEADALRVRVDNDRDSHRDNFELTWSTAQAVPTRPIPVYVPPGESRVVLVRPARAGAGGQYLQLSGDTHPFDNRIYIAPEPQAESTIVFVGADAADEPGGLLYYLERVALDTHARKLHVLANAPAAPLAWETDRPPALVVVAAELSPAKIARLSDYLQAGGTVLEVITTPAQAATLAALARVSPAAVTMTTESGDVMLGEIAFDHRLFAPLAAAQFNDFTKIHFWKHRQLPQAALGESRVVARFEGGDPAILEKAVGAGRLIVMTSGWSPADSQLARSSKFVPLVWTLAEGSHPRVEGEATHLVHGRVPLPAAVQVQSIRGPNGRTWPVARTAESFDQADEPGIYVAQTATGEFRFAVNVDPTESRTAPLGAETLEQFGCRLAGRRNPVTEREQLRQLQNAELEGRQKLWRIVIVAAIGVLVVETMVAGRLDRSRQRTAESQTP
jgi:hypothetical protein